jgi:D-arabinose 1-dehydrogenase-like Zn-dependent alcohol dehydrogenase
VYLQRQFSNVVFSCPPQVPEGYPLESAGVVLCAGITMYSPLNHWKATSGGLRVGIIGIGGLGQMGVRMAKAMGNTVSAIYCNDDLESRLLKIKIV